MAHRSFDDCAVEKLVEKGLSDAAIVAYFELVCRGGVAGIVTISTRSLAKRLGWTASKLSKTLKELEKAKRIQHDLSLDIIWMVGQIDHQWLQKGRLSDTIKKAIQNQVNDLPECKIRSAIKERYPTVWGRVSDTLSATPSDTPKPPVLVLDKEKDKDNPPGPPFTANPSPSGRVEVSKPGQIQKRELEACQKVFRLVFGQSIQPSAVGRLIHGENGDRKDCFRSVAALILFWESLNGRSGVKDTIDDPVAYSFGAAKKPTTVGEFENKAFKCDQRFRDGGMMSIGEILKQAGPK